MLFLKNYPYSRTMKRVPQGYYITIYTISLHFDKHHPYSRTKTRVPQWSYLTIYNTSLLFVKNYPYSRTTTRVPQGSYITIYTISLLFVKNRPDLLAKVMRHDHAKVVNLDWRCFGVNAVFVWGREGFCIWSADWAQFTDSELHRLTVRMDEQLIGGAEQLIPTKEGCKVCLAAS